MATPFLPKLVDDHKVGSIAELGTWESKDSTLMKAISEGIEITAKAMEKGVSSIPDIWARPLLFQMALFNNRHPLHEQVLNEWRGIISTLILSKIQNIPLTIDPVILDSNTIFGQAMQRLNPHPKGLQIGAEKGEFDGKYQWYHIFLIKLNNKPLAATSPTTLLYTASSYSDLMHDFKRFGIETDKEGAFIVEPKDPEKKSKIKTWLKWFAIDPDANKNARLKGLLNIYSQDRIVNNYCNRIINLFTSWYDQLDQEGIQEDLEVEINKNEPLLNKRDLPLFYEITLPLKPKKEEFKSDLYMAVDADVLPGKKYIIINEEAFQLFTDPRVFQSLKVSNIRDEIKNWGISGDVISNLHLPTGTIWVKPELYFLSNTLLLRDTGPLVVNKDYNRAEKFILPLQREFLECFSDNNALLELNPQFREMGNDIEFSINLPITFDERKSFIRIKRIYKDNPVEKENGKILEIQVPPVVELWPDFYDERWRRYFLYHDSASQFSFEPFSKRELNIQGEQTIDSVHLIKEFDCYPDALITKYKEEETGVILIERSKPKQGIHWNIGIDFGTSNTNVWVKKGDANAEQLHFSIKCLKITNSGDEGRISLYNYFMPPNPPRVPFITIIRVFEGDDTLNHLLRDFAIHFLETTPEPNRRLKTDIKWSGSETLLSAFFEHLSVMVAAEAMKDGADSLTLNVSYPLAFSLTQQSQFQGLWQAALQKIKSYEGIRINPEGGPQDFTESVCTGIYFERKLNAKTDRPGAISIDIGGGTSDICVWSDGHVKFQTSVILAGNDISDCFRKSEGLCKTLFRGIEANPADDTDEKKMKYVTDLRRNIRNTDLSERDTHFASVLNFYLKRYNNQIVAKLPTLVTNPYFNSLLDVLMVEFSAIVFYIGMVINKMRRDGSLQPTENALNLYWGGGASAFIKWLDFGNDTSGLIAPTLFNEIINSFEVKSDKAKLTKHPKSETAFGLVTSREKKVNVAAGMIIGGEKFELRSGEAVEFLTEIEANHIKEFQSFKTSNGLGEQFNKFLEILNQSRKKIGVKPISLEIYNEVPASIENTIAVIGDRFTRIADDEQIHHIEPVFILEVKELIRAMIEKME
jgi:hypothetical protein